VSIRTALRQARSAVLLTAALVAPAAGLAACGGAGGSGDEDAGALLDQAFSRAIPSADVDIDAQLEIDGISGFEEPLRIQAEGPYVRSTRSLPKLNLDVELSQGAGQAIQTGLLSTGDRAFVQFGGSYFEQPRAQVAATNRRLSRDRGEGGGSLADLGLDARAWTLDAQVEGTEEIGGVETEHVRGTLDVEAALKDLNRLVERSAGALRDVAEAAQPLGGREIERLSRAVDDPTFDVYVGKQDGIVRRLSLRIDVDVPEDDRHDLGGVTGASIALSAQLEDVGGDQQVEAPSSARPLSELTRQLGGLAGLAGGIGGGAPPVPDSGATDRAPSPDAGGVESFEGYAECLDRSTPDDAAAISRCARLLGP
jgi:hypothetical protein